ncbi:MAG TPA: DUF3107 domain-containing protein [Pseudonocardia sp.]
MEVKIGIVESAREILVSSDQSADDVAALVDAALSSGPDGLLQMVDEKGRKFIVRAAQISYVEIAPEDGRKVGFAIG